MTENENVGKTTERSYPVVYEKLIPIAIGVIVVLIIGMLALAVGIATGAIPS
jgi:cell division protein FtsN